MEPKEHTLKQAVQLDGKTVEKLEIKRLTGKDVLAIEQEIAADSSGKKDYATIGSAERIMRLAARSCGLSFEDFQTLDFQDVNHMSNMVSDFL